MAKSKAKPKSKYAAKIAPKPVFAKETKQTIKAKEVKVAKPIEVIIPKPTPKPTPKAEPKKTEQVHEPEEHGYVPEPKASVPEPEAPATWQCQWCGHVQDADAKQCARCMQMR
jgi:hypothetical protein